MSPVETSHSKTHVRKNMVGQNSPRNYSLDFRLEAWDVTVVLVDVQAETVADAVLVLEKQRTATAHQLAIRHNGDTIAC